MLLPTTGEGGGRKAWEQHAAPQGSAGSGEAPRDAITPNPMTRRSMNRGPWAETRAVGSGVALL